MPASVYLVLPISPTFMEWAMENIDTPITFAGGIPVGHRFMEELLAGMDMAGFVESEDYEIIA